MIFWADHVSFPCLLQNGQSTSKLPQLGGYLSEPRTLSAKTDHRDGEKTELEKWRNVVVEFWGMGGGEHTHTASGDDHDTGRTIGGCWCSRNRQVRVSGDICGTSRLTRAQPGCSETAVKSLFEVTEGTK